MFDNITIELSETELEALVRDAVERQWAPRKVAAVTIELETAYSGYGQGEKADNRFKCIKVRLNPSEPVTTPRKFAEPGPFGALFFCCPFCFRQ